MGSTYLTCFIIYFSFHYLTYYLPIYTAWYTTTPVRHKVSPTSLTLLLPTMTDCTVTKSISLPGMACLSCCVSVYLKLILLKLLPYLLTISTSLYIWIFRFSFQFNYNHSNLLSLFQVALLDVHFPPLPSPPFSSPLRLKKNQKIILLAVGYSPLKNMILVSAHRPGFFWVPWPLSQ